MSDLRPRDVQRLRDEIDVVRAVCGEHGLSLFDPTQRFPLTPASAPPEPGDIYRVTMEEIARADAVVVHCGIESTAVGYEAATASREGKPLILLTGRDRRVPSALMLSTDEPRFDVSYESLEDLARGLRGAVRLALGVDALRDQPVVPDHEEILAVVHFVQDELIRRLAREPRLLYELPSRRFEEVVAELLARKGWEVSLTAVSKDGGYDLFTVAHDARVGTASRWVIECKRFAPDRRVGIEVVRSLYGIEPVLSRGANIMLATTSWFTRGAKEFKASRYDLELRDYDDLVGWLREQGGPPGTQLEGP
jgi:hypothetical protein